MQDRWRVLALLFAVRSAMGFQFESVPALAPLIRGELGVSLADIGLLIGLYLSPGLVFAMPGGAIGRRLGDKRVVLLGLALMACGGLLMAGLPSWGAQIAGRLLAGTGAVLLNVSMSKMVTDWFSGREIATAMAIFVNSWPFGLALGLVVLPPVAGHYGIASAYVLASAVAGAGMVALAAFYRAPAAGDARPPAGGRPRGAALTAVVVAGLVWGLYNAGLGMVFGYGPTLLAERGWSVAAAGSATSLILWLVLVSVPLGGVLADRSGRPKAVILAGIVAFAIMLVIAARSGSVLASFALMGILSGVSAGPIMSLPAAVLTPATRAVGMGIFFTLFYLVVVVTPWIAGELARRSGTAATTFDFGAAMQAACLPLLLLYTIAARACRPVAAAA